MLLVVILFVNVFLGENNETFDAFFLEIFKLEFTFIPSIKFLIYTRRKFLIADEFSDLYGNLFVWTSLVEFMICNEVFVCSTFSSDAFYLGRFRFKVIPIHSCDNYL